MKKPKDYLKDNKTSAYLVNVVQAIKDAQTDAIKQMTVRCVLNAEEYLGSEIPPLVALPMVHDIAEKLIKEIEDDKVT